MLEEEPEENKNNKKTKACQQFLQASNLGFDTSSFDPKENLTPYTIYNISDTNRDILLAAIDKVNKDTLLLIVLGETTKLVETLLDERHKVFDQPLVKEFPGTISVLFIDPGIDLPNSKTMEDIEIDPRFKEKKVVSIQLVKAKFPLTPVYGPHKEIDYPFLTAMGVNYRDALSYKQPNHFKTVETSLRNKLKTTRLPQPGFLMGLRRLVHENALVVLNKLVEHPNPLFLSSRITSVCYRSFKYLIDVRAQFGRKTVVRYGYTNKNEIDECVSAEDYTVFPDPFQKCISKMNNTNFKKYYMNARKGRTNLSNNNKKNIQTLLHKMNLWANQELTKKMPKKQGGASKKRRQRTRKH
jgi:hypothetical protein